MKYQGIIKKSRTLDTASLVIVFGVIEQNLPLVRDQLGDYYGFIFIAVGIAIGLLRKATTGPLGEK